MGDGGITLFFNTGKCQLENESFLGFLKCYRKETFGQCDLDFPPPEGDNNDYQLKDGEVDSLFKVV